MSFKRDKSVLQVVIKEQRYNNLKWSFVSSLTLILLLLLVNIAHADHDKVYVAIDHAPPYSVITDEGDVSGLIIDILTQLQPYAERGYKIEPVPCPFSRCLRMLIQGEVDVLGGLIRTPKRDNLIRFVTPAYMALPSSFVFYAKQSSSIVVNNYADLKNKRIAVMRGGVYFTKFNEDRSLNKVAVPSERVAVDLLLKGRVDLVIAVEDTAEVAMSVLEQPTSKLKKVAYRYTNTIYGHMAFSKAFAKTTVAKQLMQGMVDIAQQGTLDKVIAPYHLPAIPKRLLPESP
ncbi:transporter substrate-binding domain-containing protein [Pseudoalteromonas sp. MMG013]|nr:transporter substrate-binding domain-containing protein [Pseudoalteromonas sp. MMG005]MBQ4862726.1 transporter substrate-binding domain-containing protein [Pseudoalteromonas sp. MMG013]